MAAFNCFWFNFLGKSRGKYLIYVLSFSLSLVRQKMGDSKPNFFLSFSVFSVLFFAHAHMACVFACQPLDRPDHSGFLLLVIQPSIHLDIHPIPSRPFMHSGIHPSMHPFALPHFSFIQSIPMRPNRLVASICSAHPNASCENVPSIHPCPILRASIHRAVYVNHPPCWFVLLYPGNAALVYNHVKRDSDGKFFFFFVLLRFIGSRKCLYA